MKKVVFDLLLAALGASLIGCAGVQARHNRIDSVLSSQVDVLKKIVSIRSQDAVKSKINADSLLAEQEAILMSGLTSVIDSQEAYLKIRQDNTKNRGVLVY